MKLKRVVVVPSRSNTFAKEPDSVTSQDAKDVPCKGCPEGTYPSAPKTLPGNPLTSLEETIEGLPSGTTDEPLPELEGVIYSQIWAVDQGMFAEGHLIQIIFTIPEKPEWVGSHVDGSIEYTKGLDDFEPPSPIDGYRRDPKNQWLFRPLWESCSWRNYTTMLKTKCRCIDVLAKCTVNGHWVRYEDCLKCKSRLPIANYIEPKKKTRATLRQSDLGRSSK